MKRLPIVKEAPHVDAIAEAVAVLQRGGILVYPTDTCYGLGADARNQTAVRRLIKMKQRDLRAKPFSVIVSNIAQVKTLAQTDDRIDAILRSHLPGAFTFILINLDFRISRSSSIGVRIPSCATTSMLATTLKSPYTTTSANVSGLASPYSYAELDQCLLTPLNQRNETAPDLMLDAGDLPRSALSSIIDLTHEPARLLRAGAGKYTGPLIDATGHTRT